MSSTSIRISRLVITIFLRRRRSTVAVRRMATVQSVAVVVSRSTPMPVVRWMDSIRRRGYFRPRRSTAAKATSCRARSTGRYGMEANNGQFRRLHRSTMVATVAISITTPHRLRERPSTTTTTTAATAEAALVLIVIVIIITLTIHRPMHIRTISRRRRRTSTTNTRTRSSRTRNSPTTMALQRGSPPVPEVC